MNQVTSTKLIEEENYIYIYIDKSTALSDKEYLSVSTSQRQGPWSGPTANSSA